MIDMMTFPETWEEFEKSYGFDDSEEVYTNGSRLIPSFRVRQWLDHIAHLESKRQATVSSDCIIRQAAKDVVDMELDAIDHVPEWVYDRLLTALDKVPSAQAELAQNLHTTCTDAISRQAAIDALDVLCQEHRYKIPGKIETYSQYNEAWQDALDRAEGAIFNLPSSQPERTCVNCGRTANNGGWYADGRTRCPIEEHYALPKDGYCHLWEKRNVTDDDYPERRTDG